MWEDFSGSKQAAPSDPKNLAFLGTVELKHMLMSTDQSVRAAAVQALGEKGDLSVFPQLVALLNDNTPLPVHPGTRETTLARTSADALDRMVRKAVAREPANIAMLLPYLSAARNGAVAEREAIIEILGNAGEPLALPLLESIANRDQEPLIRAKAKKAVDQILLAGASMSYTEHRLRMSEIFVGTGIVFVVLVLFVLGELVRGGVSRLLGLRILALAILGGLTAILAFELTRGRGDAAAIVGALAEGDLIALRTANYHDFSEYPGDSQVARRLVMQGNPSMIEAIRRLPQVEPDDLAGLKEMLNRRADWIAARLVVTGRSAEDLPSLFGSADPGTRKYFAELFGRLKVRNDRMVDALKKLSEDEDQEVRRAAEESLKKVRTYPEWIDPAW